MEEKTEKEEMNIRHITCLIDLSTTYYAELEESIANLALISQEDFPEGLFVSCMYAQRVDCKNNYGYVFLIYRVVQ